ncbi:hypothetical protein EMCRGX_G024680 [Ephydatia muelleri]|eukprot:Em0015g823a
MKLVVLMFLSLLALSSAIDYGDNVSPIAYLQSNNLNTGATVGVFVGVAAVIVIMAVVVYAPFPRAQK